MSGPENDIMLEEAVLGTVTTKPKVYHIDVLDAYNAVRILADEKGLKTYDTAVPMQFTDDVFDKLGVSIWAHGIVWCYDSPSIWGSPYPLTYEANLILWMYQKVTGIRMMYAVDPKEM